MRTSPPTCATLVVIGSARTHMHACVCAGRCNGPQRRHTSSPSHIPPHGIQPVSRRIWRGTQTNGIITTSHLPWMIWQLSIRARVRSLCDSRSWIPISHSPRQLYMRLWSQSIAIIAQYAIPSPKLQEKTALLSNRPTRGAEMLGSWWPYYVAAQTQRVEHTEWASRRVSRSPGHPTFLKAAAKQWGSRPNGQSHHPLSQTPLLVLSWTNKCIDRWPLSAAKTSWRDINTVKGKHVTSYWPGFDPYISYIYSYGLRPFLSLFSSLYSN